MAYYDNYSKEEKKQLAKEKVEKALTKIQNDVVSIFRNTCFPEYLKFAARFHYFDVNNTILTYMQKPDATFFASFKAWEKFSVDNWGDPNRPIFTSSQKGMGVGILAPYILKKTIKNPSDKKETGVSYLDYHVVFVFDKAQTNNIPIPVMSWDLSKTTSDCIALFNAFKEKAPFDIVFSNEINASFRYSYENSKSPDARDSLVLNLKDKADFYLLCSYIIKIFVLHSLKSALKNLPAAEIQKICECVTFMLSSYFGLPTDDYIFFFVESWGDYEPEKELTILKIIQSSAHRLIDILEDEMVFYKSTLVDVDFNDNNDVFEFNTSFDF